MSEVHLGALHGEAVLGFACLGVPLLAGSRGSSGLGDRKSVV